MSTIIINIKNLIGTVVITDKDSPDSKLNELEDVVYAALKKVLQKSEDLSDSSSADGMTPKSAKNSKD